ncbi:MAG TPA: transglycosylase SLT domain-containing protein [Bdellovibrionales bacterium]|nr:transglycosylase SLT domain-containing protein [Bdellovibrionales bacterium]
MVLLSLIFTTFTAFAQSDDAPALPATYTPPAGSSAYTLTGKTHRATIQARRGFHHLPGGKGSNLCNIYAPGDGLTVIEAEGVPEGWSMVVMDTWDKTCDNPAIDRRIGFVENRFLKKAPEGHYSEGTYPGDVFQDAAQAFASTPETAAVPEWRPEAEPCLENKSGADSIVAFAKNYRASAGGLKSQKEIDEYVACYAGAGYDDYVSEYRPLIQKASEHFDVSRELLTCLLFRESQFLPSNKSHTGAVGLGQHIKPNILEVNRLTAKETQKKKAGRASKTWVGYLRDVRKTMPDAAYCHTQFDDKGDAQCPTASIGAAAVYLQSIEKCLMKRSTAKTIDKESTLNFLVAKAVGYNMGDSLACKTVKDNPNVDSWLKMMVRAPADSKKQDEVQDHINAVRNCLQYDNWGTLSKRDTPKTREQCQDIASDRGVPTN